MVDISTIYLVDAVTDEIIEAELHDAIEQAQLDDWKLKWQPALLTFLQELVRQSVPRSQWPQSWHWDWSRKTSKVQGLLASRGFSVVSRGVTEGLALVDMNRFGREASQLGKPLVYLDYLEVAPWNRPEFNAKSRLRGVSSALVAAAANLSVEEGFKGRLGLHSLPKADDFYRKIGMTDLGPDPNYQNLRYFELTAAKAKAFLGEE